MIIRVSLSDLYVPLAKMRTNKIQTFSKRRVVVVFKLKILAFSFLITRIQLCSTSKHAPHYGNNR